MAEPGKRTTKRAAKTPVPEGEPVTVPAPAEVPVPTDVVTVAGTPGTEGAEAAAPEGSGSGQAPETVPAAQEPEPEMFKDPVEILVGLAERGEIDPWNIDIIEVTDRFLSELERCRQLNLQISGRTLFYAATLLRMKSEQLDVPSEDEEGEGEGEDYDLAGDPDFEDEGRLGPIERLEREIQRRLDRKNLRKSPVTLFELIIELKNLEKEERRRRRLPPPDEDYLVEADDVVSIAHEEGYQDTSRQIIEECLANADPTTEITLAELCKDLGWKLPEVYLPLLFIALDGRCSIRQEEFFGDVYVHVVKEEEVRADEGQE